MVPHEPALRAWLQRRRVAGLETDDVIQETYAVLAGLASVAHIGSPRAYAFQTAQSLVWRHLRRAKVARIDASGDVEALSLPLDRPSPEREAASRQELRFVAALIEALPPKCREAFLLRKVDGLSQREVAQRMGISDRTVEKHIARALGLLSRGLAQAGLPPSPRRRKPAFEEARSFGW